MTRGGARPGAGRKQTNITKDWKKYNQGKYLPTKKKSVIGKQQNITSFLTVTGN